jgi:RHS repeat-associated protein
VPCPPPEGRVDEPERGRGRGCQYNWFNQLLAVTGPSGTTSFGYDGNGNQVAKSDSVGTTTYAYNYDNRLLGITAPGGVTSSFEYDANGLRTKKSDSTGTRSYLLDGLSVVAEYAPDASKMAWYTQSLSRIDEVLSVVNSSGKHWYEADALGSTYAMTNAAGALVSWSAYDVFGERNLAAGADLGQPFGFTGREHDASGLLYARARYLSPHLGRWDRPDPLALMLRPEQRREPALDALGGGPHEIALYESVAQNPVRYLDPLGWLLSPWILYATPPGLQWFSIAFGLFQLTLQRQEDAALIRPRAPNDCSACLEATTVARVLIWRGTDPLKRRGEDSLISRMEIFFLLYLAGGFGSLPEALRANLGHRVSIENKQKAVMAAAMTMTSTCTDPELRDLGQWYLYLAMLPLPSI